MISNPVVSYGTGWLTALTGVWFLVSARGSHPLALLFSRPLLEGRLGWPDRWDEVWERVPRFRRVWRVTNLLWGASTCTPPTSPPT